jgi:hypothetical protein
MARQMLIFWLLRRAAIHAISKTNCFGVFALFQGYLLMSIHRPGE